MDTERVSVLNIVLSFIEQFKMALNKKEYARTVLMDVSRAFGTKTAVN